MPLIIVFQWPKPVQRHLITINDYKWNNIHYPTRRALLNASHKRTPNHPHHHQRLISQRMTHIRFTPPFGCMLLFAARIRLSLYAPTTTSKTANLHLGDWSRSFCCCAGMAWLRRRRTRGVGRAGRTPSNHDPEQFLLKRHVRHLNNVRKYSATAARNSSNSSQFGGTEWGWCNPWWYEVYGFVWFFYKWLLILKLFWIIW